VKRALVVFAVGLLVWLGVIAMTNVHWLRGGR
jgi:hypothetical protein